MTKTQFYTARRGPTVSAEYFPQRWCEHFALYKTFAEGVLLVMCFLWLPEGMFGGIALWIERLTSKKSDRQRTAKAVSWSAPRSPASAC